MSLDIERTFKMNSDFWPQARGPPGQQLQQQQQQQNAQQQPQNNNNFPSLMDTSSDYHRNQNFHASENNNVDMKEHLMAQSAAAVVAAENSQNFTQSSPFPAMNQTPTNGQQGQQQPLPSTSPGAENSSPEVKFNAEKLVHEIQVSFY